MRVFLSVHRVHVRYFGFCLVTDTGARLSVRNSPKTLEDFSLQPGRPGTSREISLHSRMCITDRNSRTTPGQICCV